MARCLPKAQRGGVKAFKPLLLLAAVVVLHTGCSTSGHTKAGQTSSSLQKAAQDVDKANEQVETVRAALTDLVSNPGDNLKPQFQKFTSEVSKLESFANDISNHAAAMQSRGAAYFQQWDAELAKIHNEDIRTRSQDRRNAVAARFDLVRVNYSQTKTAFAPLMSDLKDIRTALGTDLTTGGLASVRGSVSKANSDTPAVRESLGRLAADFKELGISLSTATPPLKLTQDK